MNIKLMSMLLLAATTLSVQAGPSPAGDQRTTNLNTVSTIAPEPIRGQRALELLALETDLTPRIVRMVLTHRAAESYSFRFQRNAARQFQSTLGEERYASLMEGQPIELYSMKVRDAVRSSASTSHGRAQSILVAIAD